MKLPRHLILTGIIQRPSRNSSTVRLFLTLVLAGLYLSACQGSEPNPEPDPTLQTPQVASDQATAAPKTAEPTAQPIIDEVTSTSFPIRTPLPTGTSAPTATALAACFQEPGRMETGSFRSDQLKLPMEYRLWLPPCYDSEPERRFPLLLMVHGQNYNEDQWDRLGIDETAERLIQAGEIPPFIIAMPRDRNWQQPSQDAFGDVVADEFLPWLDGAYRTLPERQFRAIGGLSRGAGWAVHLGLSRWDLFGAVGGHSLPVFWEDTSKIRRWLEKIPAEQMPRIYLDIGDHDRPEIAKSVAWFEQLLTDLGIAHEWHLYVGFHEEAYWQRHVEEYVRWYSSGWIK